MTIWYNPELDEIGVLMTHRQDYLFVTADDWMENMSAHQLVVAGWVYVGEL